MTSWLNIGLDSSTGIVCFVGLKESIGEYNQASSVGEFRK
jgi:hypothetical protein